MKINTFFLLLIPIFLVVTTLQTASYSVQLPIIIQTGIPNAQPISQAATFHLLETGQTTPYQGNISSITTGNRDDGDLMNGRARRYFVAPGQQIVTDTQTGLMWVRDLTGVDDLSEGHSWEEALEIAEAFEYAGYDDWRMPTLKELQTLVDYGHSEPSIDMTAFPTPFTDYSTNYFWTSTTYPQDSSKAFYTNFLNGHTYPFKKTSLYALRPVRDVVVSNPVAILQTGQTIRYANGDNGDLQAGVAHHYEREGDFVTDRVTGLMWVRDPLPLLDDVALDWQSGIKWVNQLEYGGYSDWRMPNIIELESISQAGREGGLFDETYFVNAPVDFEQPEAHIWWSSTSSAYTQNEFRLGRDAAWYVTSAYGSTNFVAHEFSPAKSRTGFVRPVRDVAPVWSEALYRLEVRDSADFQTITTQSQAGKFLLPLDQDPLYQNVNLHPLHYDFLRAAFPAQYTGLTTSDYTNQTLYRATREFWAGGLRAFNDSEGNIVYGFALYTDNVDEAERPTEAEVVAAYETLSETFRRRPFVYAPTDAGAIEDALNWDNESLIVQFPAPVAAPDYAAYTVGQAVGVVRLLSLEELAEQAKNGLISQQDIVVVDATPTDLEAIVSGIVTGDQQGELSHLAIRTARRGTPNAYIKEASTALAPYAGQLVRINLTRTGYYVETDVTQAEADSWWALQRPEAVEVVSAETHTTIDTLQTIGTTPNAVAKVGGKAANLAQLYTFLPDQYEVPGLTIPFGRYANFMQTNTLLDRRSDPPIERTYADYVICLHEDPAFRTDAVLRAQLLDDLHDEIRDNGQIDPAFISLLATQIESTFGRDKKVRFRSSSNAEDGLAFNGAGLYDSTSVCLADNLDEDDNGPSHCDPTKTNERTIERGLRKVWASLWNFRAWEEREYYGIDHLEVAMAVLITPAFPDEEANGVAFTGDPTNPENSGYLVNVQVGDTSVVLPDPGIVPESDQIFVDEEGMFAGVQRLRGSSLLPEGEWVLSEEELTELGEILALIETNYPLELGDYAREDVLLDIEFKLDDGLIIKQIRPFLISSPQTNAHAPVLRVKVPEPIQLCGTWREGFGIEREAREKTTLALSGEIEIDLNQTESVHDLFGALHYGEGLDEVATSGDGVVRVEPMGNGDTQRVTVGRTYQRGNETLDLQLSFVNVRNEFDMRWLDEVALTRQFSVVGLVKDSTNGAVRTRLRLAPCGLETLELVEIVVPLEGGEIVLEQRRERFDGVSGLADLVSATVTLPEGSQVSNRYANLIYAADRHHWNQVFRVLLDEPLGDVVGVLVREVEGGFSAELIK